MYAKQYSLAMLLMLLTTLCKADIDLLDLSIEELMDVKITSATLSDETLRTVPSSVTVYTRNEIRQLGLRRLEELMNLVPGFQASRSDPFALNLAYSSRSRRIGSSGVEVLILIDGQRINSDWIGGANLFDAAISLENVERVEFIRGPGSTLYGSNAMMGIVNVITRSDNEVKVAGGSHQRYDVSAQWNSGNPNRNIEFYGAKLDDQGESLNVYEPSTAALINTHDPYQVEDFQLKAHWDEWRASIRHARRSNEQFYVVGLVNNDINEFNTESSHAQVQWSHPLSTNLNLATQLFVADHQYQIRTTTTPVATNLTIAGLKEREYGARVFLQDTKGNQRWLAGLEYRYPEIYDRIVAQPTSDNPIKSHREISGFFGQYQQDFNTNATLTIGARMDHYTDFGSNTSPRLGVIKHLNTNHTLKLLYSEAFRAPTRIETGVISSGTLVGNSDLKPEIAKTSELIWIFSSDKTTLASTLFHTDIKDAVSEVAVGTGNRRTWENGHESLAGAELEWQQEIYEHFKLRFGLTHIFDEPSAINSEATTLASMSLIYQNAAWTASLYGNFQGERRNSTEEDVPPDVTTMEYRDMGGYSIFGFHVRYQWRPTLEFFGNIKNIFDKESLSPASRYTNIIGVPGRGIDLNLGVHWYFN